MLARWAGYDAKQFSFERWRVMAGVNYRFEYKVEAHAVEQTTKHEHTWTRMRDDAPVAMSVYAALRDVVDVSRVKLWTSDNMAAIGVSMVDACADGLASIAEVVSTRVPAYCCVLTWREESAPKENAGIVTRNDAHPETRAMYVLVTDDDAARFNGSYEVIGRSGNGYFIQRDPRRDTREVDAVVKSYLDIERAWKNYLTGNTSPTLANYNPPTGFVHSREFGLGEVVCVNGAGPYEVTIDTHRGERKTFTWDPAHDRKATPRESATMAYRVALTMRQKWMTDGFGQPLPAYVETCGIVAATWVEHAAREALTVSDLLTQVRLRMSLT